MAGTGFSIARYLATDDWATSDCAKFYVDSMSKVEFEAIYMRMYFKQIQSFSVRSRRPLFKDMNNFSGGS